MIVAETASWSRRHSQAFAATVAAIALVPWTVRHWPSQDGPNHLAVAHVLATYADPGSAFPRYLSIQTGFRPSTALYAILCAAGRFVPLEIAEKCLVSLALVLLPVSVLLFVRRAVPRRSANVLLAMPFVLGWAFAMGFLSFQLGLGLGVVALALAWEPRSPPGRGVGIAWRHGLASLAYFLSVWFHPVVALITGLALVLLEGKKLLRWSEWPRVLVVVGPAAAFLVLSYFAADPGPSTRLVPPKTHFSDPVSVLGAAFEYNIGYSPFELVPRIAALALIVPFVYRSLRAHAPWRAGPEAAVGRLVVALVVLYCVMPGTLADWYYCSARFLVYAWLLLPVAAELPARIVRRLPVVGPVLAGAVLAIQWPVIHRDSRQMQDVLDVGSSLPRGARLVPLAFELSVLGPQPVGAAWGELVVGRDAVVSQLFASGRPRMGGERFRTLTFRPGVLDEESGTLPWSGAEMSDVWRPCADPRSPERWFVHVDGSCADALAARKRELDEVIDRYDYVLMLGPSRYGQELMASRLHLVRESGSARMYAVVHADPPG
ncbi:MAG TPA: hypothetical protein VGL81_18070 [Polyangiaceae bacterium]